MYTHAAVPIRHGPAPGSQATCVYLPDEVDDAFDVAARAGLAACVGVLLLAAAVAALALAPERLVRSVKSGPSAE